MEDMGLHGRSSGRARLLSHAERSGQRCPPRCARWADTGLACDFVSEDRWVPDAAATSCMVSTCSTRFGLLQRRHHCRFCGHVVCGACSSHAAYAFDGPFAAAGREQLQRICRECNAEILSRLDALPRIQADAVWVRRFGLCLESWTQRLCFRRESWSTGPAWDRELAEQHTASSAQGHTGRARNLQAQIKELEQHRHSLQSVNTSSLGHREVADHEAQLAQTQAALEKAQEQRDMIEEMRNANGAPARMCPRCRTGPFLNDHCEDLARNNEDQRNNCPNCNWFDAKWTNWPEWDGIHGPH